MSLSLPARRYFFRTGPRASQLAIPGSIAVLPVTTSASYLNLALLYTQSPGSTLPAGAALNSSFSDQQNGVQGTRVVLYADGADVGIILGALSGDVSGANAPVLATQGTLVGGAYTSAAGTCWRIPAGTTFEFEPVLTQDFFLGFVGSTSGSLRVFQVSGSNA
jgi:hypothetical protein